MTLRLHSKRNRLITILFAMIAGSLLLIGAMNVQAPQQVEEPLLTLNGQEVTAAEFNWHLQMNRALTADYFKQTYDADYSEKFWSTDYTGEKPIHRWIKESQTQLLTKRMELQLAQEAGVVSDISFEGFLKGMGRENQRRSQAVANKEVVYGPLHLEAQAYYSYYMSDLEDATIEAMRSNGGIVISDEQVRLEYEANLAAKYSRPGAIRLEWASLPFGPETEYKDQQEALEKMELLRAAVIAAEIRSDTGIHQQAKELGINLGEVKITSASRRTAALENPKALLAADQLAPGQISGLFAENGAIHLLYCLSVEDAGVEPFNQVKDAITLHLAQQKFRSMVDDQLGKVIAEWNYPMAERLANQANQ
ncbi:peptidyl-prolyl cis-trans isomerase [Paenibacillus nitricinens]|uniref:peptidyl-prolyl cis-trans isomerase n=1 Tax=Paenibacillus TaxID=44249 RepID=UPI0030FA6D0B